MLWNPFVARVILHGSFSTSIEAFERGDRPQLALMTPPQMGKSIAAEDFAAWIAG
jgi:hypothetical protein